MDRLWGAGSTRTPNPKSLDDRSLTSKSELKSGYQPYPIEIGGAKIWPAKAESIISIG